MRIPPIRTERLLLRPPRLSDADAVVPLMQDPAIPAFTLVPSPYTRRHWTSWVKKQQKGPEKRPEGLSFPFVIERDGALVAMVGVRWDAKDRSANLGYWVGKPYRRQGIATEAAQAICDYAFSKLGAERAWATVFSGNRGSPEVLKNCGMRFEGTLRSHQVHRGRRVDVEYYSVLRSEWKGRRRR